MFANDHMTSRQKKYKKKKEEEGGGGESLQKLDRRRLYKE